MRKLYKYFLLTLILGCSSDDIKDSRTQLKIEHFNITVSEITQSSAQISWNITEIGIAEGVSENNLLFDIYLSDSLVIENISQNGYTLENLDFGTEYSCKLIVKEDSNNQVEIPFEVTTDVIQLRIEHFNILVSEITESSAQISWNITQIGIAEGISEYNLLYDIYLDDSLVIENISEDVYMLENLDFDTEYSCKLTIKQSSNNQVEIPFEFETILDYSNYYPLELGNIWYYELNNIDPFQSDRWQITEEIISVEIIDNKENYLIEQNKLWYFHYSNGTTTYPCTTTINHFYLRFENDVLIKRNSSSEESIVIDFNEIPSGSVYITEECDVPFYDITSCVYERRQEFGGYGEIYRYMHQIGKISKYSSDGTASSDLELIGFKRVNSDLIGNEHNIVCD